MVVPARTREAGPPPLERPFGADRRRASAPVNLNKWLSPLLHATGYFGRRWRGHAAGEGFTVVLCYHRVAHTTADSRLLTVERGLAPDVFEAQIRFMQRHFE